jgi:hypothetical protein
MIDTTDSSIFKAFTTSENPVKVEPEKRLKTDRNKVALRLNSKTIILVNPENCNEEYAEEQRKRFNLN